VTPVRWENNKTLFDKYCSISGAIESGSLPSNNNIKNCIRPSGFQEVEAPSYQFSRHMIVVTLSALRTDLLYHPLPPPLQEIFLVLVYIIGWVGRKEYVNEKFQWHNRESIRDFPVCSAMSQSNAPPRASWTFSGTAVYRNIAEGLVKRHYFQNALSASKFNSVMQHYVA